MASLGLSSRFSSRRRGRILRVTLLSIIGAVLAAEIEDCRLRWAFLPQQGGGRCSSKQAVPVAYGSGLEQVKRHRISIVPSVQMRSVRAVKDELWIPVEAEFTSTDASVAVDNSDPSSTITLVGYFVAFLSFFLFTPQAVRLWGSKNTEGASETTWLLKLFSTTSTTLYSLHLCLPFNAFSDVLVLAASALAVVSLLFAFGSEQQRGVILPAMVLYVAWVSAFALDGIPETGFQACQALSSCLLGGALVPQLWLNWQQGSAGNFSPLTCSLGLVLCSCRVFTTVSTSGDPLLLATFGFAAIANAALTTQIVFYGSQRGLGLKDIFTSDFKSQ